ncbi:MAG: glycosyltransferase family 2 protein [Patescibacteria group bacterium]|jgi:hypothetical protein
MAKGLSIITVTYNSREYILECLASIWKQETKTDFEVIVFDNASGDGTAGIIKKDFSNTTLIESEKNTGICMGNNEGAKASKYDYLLFLNPDTKLPEGSIDNLYKAISEYENEGVILIPEQRDYDTGEFLHCGLGLDVLGFPINQGRGKNYFYADGAAILMSKKNFMDIGMFDEDLFLIYDDIDLSWRARLFGLEIKLLDQVYILHKRGHTIDKDKVGGEHGFSTSVYRRYYGERNSLRILLKNYSLSNLIWTIPCLILISISEIIVYLVLGNFALIKAYGEAYLWNVRNFYSTLQERRWIQKKRTVSDKLIMRHMYKGSGKLRLLSQVGIPEVSR